MKRLLWFLPFGIAGYLGWRRVSRTLRRVRERRYPNFVYQDVGPAALGVPVFTYHSVGSPAIPDSVTPAEFERDMQYLAQSGYHTLAVDELYNHLVHGEPVAERSVLLTFDDGRATLWTVAYPILKRYGHQAVCFLVPGAMSEADGIRPNLDNEGDAALLDELFNADLSDMPTITWDEARAMHASGLVDFQSHTLAHTLVYYAPEIVDFVRPASDFGYHNYEMPVLRWGAEDRMHERPPLGTPIYRSRPRMGPARRFFDDEALRQTCIDYTAQHDGATLFDQPDWRAQLLRIVDNRRKTHGTQARFETEAEQVEAIRYSLARSKALIEEHLPGHTVQYLCYPWHRYSMRAAALAQEAGYISTFVDINSQKPLPDWRDAYSVQRALPTNAYGDDPHRITRIDARDGMVLSLPGEHRLSYIRRVLAHLLRPPALLRRSTR